MYFPIPPVPPIVEFDRSAINELLGVHLATADALSRVLGDTATTADPVLYAQPLAAGGIATHDRYNGIIDEGWNQTAQDQQHLSVAEQLEQDRVIGPPLRDGEDRTLIDGQTIGGGPEGPGLGKGPFAPLGQVFATSQRAVSQASDEHGAREHLEPDILPWQAINEAVATGAAAEIFHEIGGPARINAIDSEVRSIDAHIDEVKKMPGPQGPQGPPGPQGNTGEKGDRGDRGADGRDAQILI